jgi:predicted transcriptional regulator
MKQILIELDDRCARDLERVAPAKNRRRAEFIRLAIRRAIDLALDRATVDAYRGRPLSDELGQVDLVGWDEQNGLATASRTKRSRGVGTTNAA